MGNIFICYRREDSQFITDRIFDHLTSHFPRECLFKDVDNIPPGVDFRTHIDNAVKNSAAVLAIIGPGWLSARDGSGQRRLDDPNDSVYVEISSALRLRRLIIPLLVGHARMPKAAELPVALQPLAYINALPIRSDPDFRGDFTKLQGALKQVAGRRHVGWITRMTIAAIALGAVGAIAWYAIGPQPELPRSLPTIGTVPAPSARSAPAAPPSTTPANGCAEVPFTDTSKFPPVISTKRICE